MLCNAFQTDDVLHIYGGKADFYTAPTTNDWLRLGIDKYY